MASLQVSRLLLSSSSSCSRPKAAVSIPKLPKFHVSIPKIPVKKQSLSVKEPSFEIKESDSLSLKQKRDFDPIQRARLNAVLEEVMDRIEMHKNIGDQRNNWNSLLLNSVNMITLTAALMAGIAVVNANGGDSVTAVKIASTVLLTSATGFVALMSKIQPSQLAEEQRNATRLFKKLRNEIEMFLRENEEIDEEDVKEAIQRVLGLDKAYPLPLIGTMLEKYPQEFKPATWWPENKRRNP
ncbi:putative F-box protein [Cardamine amara subsp. amara]|uniref:F-box protein n=1 Tax=Cardamine amara subsp. amara TaxID=228776 RepID=A0ABD1A4V0_CARAN